MITWIGGLGGTSELGRSRDCGGSAADTQSWLQPLNEFGQCPVKFVWLFPERRMS
jgi:hypothetical protein